MRSLLLLMCTAGCGFSITANATDGAVVDDAAVAADVPAIDAPDIDGSPLMPLRRITVGPRTETLTDFPVWIALTDLQLAADSAGNVPYFTRTDGGAVPFEIQRWDAASGTLEAWVKLTLDANQPTSILLRPGDGTTEHVSTPAAVFGGPFLAVWHFEPGALYADARGGNNGTAGGAPTAAAGKLGSGVMLDGDDDEVRVTNPFTGNSTTSHTFSAWVSSTTTETFGTIITLGENSQNRARWFHTRYPQLSGGFYNNDFRPESGAAVPAGFHLVHWVYDSSGNRTSRLYIDGAQVATGQMGSGIQTRGTAGFIGNSPSTFGETAFKGVLDEIRLANATRSAEWIAAEFANQSAPQTFYSVQSVSN